MNTRQIVRDAKPAFFLAHPPYKADLFCSRTGWAGVLNSNGVNVLTFKSKPGAVVADFKTCKLIARRWNRLLSSIVDGARHG